MFNTGLTLRENEQYALCATGADDCIHFMMSEFFSAVNNIRYLLNAHPAKVVESQAFADTFPARFVRTLYHLIRQDWKPIEVNVVIECSLTDSHVNSILNEALTCGGVEYLRSMMSSLNFATNAWSQPILRFGLLAVMFSA